MDTARRSDGDKHTGRRLARLVPAGLPRSVANQVWKSAIENSPFAMRLCTVTTGQTKPAAVSLATASATPGIKVSSSSRSCFRGSTRVPFKSRNTPRRLISPLSNGQSRLRNIGAVVEPVFYLTPRYAQAYDGIVFFDQVTPSTLIPLPFSITTTSLASGKSGAFYFQNLVSTYATPNVTWRLASGSLPPGLSLASNGVLSGTAQSSGAFSFNVTTLYAGSPGPTWTIRVSISQ